MTEDDRNPGREPTPDGYFGWPEGQDSVQFLDENGKPMTREEWDRRMAEKARLRKAKGKPTTGSFFVDGREVGREEWLKCLEENERRPKAEGKGKPDPSASPPEPRV